MFLDSFLQIKGWPISERSFIYKSFIVAFLISGITLFSQTFRILYIYDNYGIIQGGLYLTVVGLITFLLDYPTANLSDKIGQRGVIIIALFTHSIAIYILATTTTLNGLFLTAILEGIAVAQFSGTLLAWFDNNYKIISEKFDKEYIIYMDLAVKLQLSGYIGVFCFSIAGGYIAFEYSRSLGLLTEAILSIAIIFMIIYFMTDIRNIDTSSSDQRKSIFVNFKEGIKFYFSNKRRFLLITSSFSMYIAGFLFTQTMFIPLYYGYTGSELLISILDRIQVIITMIIQLFLMKKILSKIKSFNSYFYFLFLGLFMFSFIPVIIYFYPFKNKFYSTPLLILWIVWLLLDFFNLIGFTLFRRKMSMEVPSEFRNSIYSLSSSLTTLFVLILLPLITFIYSTYSMINALIILIVINSIAMFILYIEKRTDNVKNISVAE